MSLADWRRLLEAEAKRQGMTLDGYLACRFFFSELSRKLAEDFIERIRKAD